MLKTNVIVIEDKAGKRQDLIEILKKNNFVVKVFERTGSDFRSVISSASPDIVIVERELYKILSRKKTNVNLHDFAGAPVMVINDPVFRGKKDQNISPAPYELIDYPLDEKMLLASIRNALYIFEMASRLKENEEQYKSLIELAPMAIGIHMQGKVVYANPAAVKLLGAGKLAELVGKPIINFVHPDYRAKAVDRMKVVLEKQISVRVLDEKFVTLQGKEIDVEVVAMPTKHLNKSAVQVAINDVTELRKREKINQAALDIFHSADSSDSLDQLYGHLHKILKGIMPAKNFFISLLDGTGTVLSFPYFSDEKIKRPADRKLGSGLTEYLLSRKKTVLLTYEDIVELIKKGKIDKNNFTARNVIGVPLRIKGQIIGLMVVKEYEGKEKLGDKEKEMMELISFPVSRSIERKMAEAERKSYINNLKELNSTKDKFFSIISHDLRSPFNSILGFTEIMKEELPNLSRHELKTYIDSLYQSTRNIYSLLNNLLQFSRFQLGSMEFYPERLNLKEMVERNLDMMRGNAVRKKISLVGEVNPRIMVLADIDMLNSVFQNLISNAIKFTRTGGSVKLQATDKGNHVEIKISDTGIGMSKKILEGLFKIENRKSRSGTRHEGGTGLGLLLTKEYIEKDGGTLEVQSKAGKGSTFTFRLKKSGQLN